MLTADLLDIGIRLESVPSLDCSWSDLWCFIVYCQPRHRIYSKVTKIAEDAAGASLWSSPIVTNQLLAGLLHASMLSMWAKGRGKGSRPKMVPSPFTGMGETSDGRQIKGVAMRGNDLWQKLYNTDVER